MSEEKNLIEEDNDAVILYQKDSVELSQLYKQFKETAKRITADLPEKMRENATDDAFESSMWDYIKGRTIPDEVIKERKGSEGKMYEYFPEFYTTSELDRLFPGWWFDKMQTTYIPQAMCFITTGYIVVEYTLPSGRKKIRPIYACGGDDVEGKRHDKSLPSQPGFKAAGSVTRFIKLAGKRLGIGLEIYHQNITPPMQSKFEDIVREWGSYGDEVKAICKTITKGSAFRRFCRNLPQPEQTARFIKEVIPNIPANKIDIFWKNFIKLTAASATKWLDEIIIKLNNKATASEKTETINQQTKEGFEYE